jgi:signal peptidase II
MGSHAQGGGIGAPVSMAGAAPAKSNPSWARAYLWGPLSACGLFVAAAACLADQAAKLWLLSALHLASRGPLALTRFAELVLTWNTGISYGLFPQNGPIGPWALLGFKVAAVVFLWVWLVRTSSRLTAVSLGLIIGGAVGNAIDRLHWPGVMDFVLLHVETAGFSFRWYVFNLADVAIVAGVAGLLYESLRRGGAVKAP